MRTLRLLSVFSLLLAGCADDNPDEPSWSYEGDTGPDRWGELSEDWAVCGEGQAQSPIDLDSALVMEDVNEYGFTNAGTVVNIYNNGHTILYGVDAGNTVAIDGVDYELLQFHFHAGSEHTVDTVGYPMEVHFVHSDVDGNLAVLGVFIEEGAENPTLAGALWDSIPAEVYETVDDATVTCDPYELIPGGVVWKYDGSLTTPPCSEGVNWNVFMTPITMSAAQMDAFTALYANNYRPVQPLNDRTVTFGE